MLLLTLGVAIFNLHTRLTCLETDAPLLAALRTVDVDLVHRDISINILPLGSFIPPNLFLWGLRIYDLSMRPRTALLAACPWLSRDEASDALRNANGNAERAIEAVTAAHAVRKRQSSTTTTTNGDDTIAEEKKRMLMQPQC